MEKEEKINFIVDMFNSAISSHLSGGIFLPEEEEVWLNRYISSNGDFPTELDTEQDLDAAYQTALHLSRI